MDRRYDNYDVRTDKRLRPLAYEFLKQYKGDFSFLNECRRFLNDRGYLGDSHVRGVLNSMLADPTVTNMPVPIKTVFDARDKSLAVEFTEPVETASLDTRKVELPGVRNHRRITLPTRWRFEMGVSNHKRSCAIHRVDLKRSHGELWTRYNWIDWRFYWMCGKSPAKPHWTKVALFSAEDAVLMEQTGDASHVPHLTEGEKVRDWKMCRACDGQWP